MPVFRRADGLLHAVTACTPLWAPRPLSCGSAAGSSCWLCVHTAEAAVPCCNLGHAGAVAAFMVEVKVKLPSYGPAGLHGMAWVVRDGCCHSL